MWLTLTTRHITSLFATGGKFTRCDCIIAYYADQHINCLAIKHNLRLYRLHIYDLCALIQHVEIIRNVLICYSRKYFNMLSPNHYKCRRAPPLTSLSLQINNRWQRLLNHFWVWEVAQIFWWLIIPDLPPMFFAKGISDMCDPLPGKMILIHDTQILCAKGIRSQI